MKQIFFGILIFFLLLVGFSFGDDLLDQAIDQAAINGNIVELGSTVDSVGQQVLGGGYTITLFGKPVPPMIVGFTKWLLRFVVGLGVTMFLYGGIAFLLSQGDESKMKKARSNLVIAGIGIFMALASVAIINLMQSFVKTVGDGVSYTNEIKFL